MQIKATNVHHHATHRDGAPKVAFVWGVFIFDEHVRSRTHATMAILLMIVGLWGMSYFSSPQKGQMDQVINEENSLAQSLLSDHNDYNECASNENDDASTQNNIHPQVINFEGRFIRLNPRQIGLLCATIDGVWGGSILVPMHFARYNINGLSCLTFGVTFGCTSHSLSLGALEKVQRDLDTSLALPLGQH